MIGAGVAGLAAAGELGRQGFRVAVYEARDRVGGRILTHRDARFPMPLELGAEFIHGEAPLTGRLLREARLSGYDLEGDFWLAKGGHFHRDEGFWDEIDRVFDAIDARKKDVSFDQFLAQRPGGKSLARAREAARLFVQGFHAADPAELSVLSIAPKEAGEPSEEAARAGRVVEGYDRLADWLARDLGDDLHLGTPVREIAWERGRVELALEDGSRIAARAAVVTVPLGVLQAPPDAPGGIRFRPDPPKLRQALDLLAMGTVVRLVLGFRELPWHGRGDLGRIRFLQIGDETFRVWWTAYPLRLPVLVAWSGGPPAAVVSSRNPEEIEAAALGALAKQTGISRQRIASRLEAVWSHDWNGDPFSRGAYSYARVGGSEAAKALARPIEKTLFFAGEAADEEGRTGTVEGAIGTGLRAAKQVKKALGYTARPEGR
ncbi:MAG TPA: NAD(P)/FAD-dependent oxidoreductase [Thermoanaerobaculia bacterium]|nr:NAD(P)/FAD-dependent oxidoreductase [Thermoanaerobaculia bacterium]